METQYINFQEGDILKVNRGKYYHFGVYVKNNQVIHFSGGLNEEIDPTKARIIITTLKDFEKDGIAEIANQPFSKRYPGYKIAENARSFIGSDMGGYNLITNNCEHFARRCESGVAKSDQVYNAVNSVCNKVIDTFSTLFSKL